MLITIIIPIYNSENHLVRCLDSIYTAKRNFPIELILVNDGSTDNSQTICEEYASKHKNINIISQKNEGLSSARNAGLKIAKGEYISFIDSDDTIESNYFSSLLPYIESKYDVINFGYNRIEDEEVIKQTAKNSVLNRNDIIEIITNSSINKFLWFVWRRIYKRSFLLNHNIFFNKDIKYAEDSVFTLEVLSQLNCLVTIEECLYNYIETQNSLTAQTFKDNLLQKMEIQYIKRLEIKFPDIEEKDILKDVANNYINHTLFSLLHNLKYSHGNKLKEIHEIRNSIIYKETLKNYRYDWTRPKRSILIKLFELKLFKTLFHVLKIK